MRELERAPEDEVTRKTGTAAGAGRNRVFRGRRGSVIDREFGR